MEKIIIKLLELLMKLFKSEKFQAWATATILSILQKCADKIQIKQEKKKEDNYEN